MRLYFDPETDALFLRIDESAVVDSDEVHPGVFLDFNDRDEVVGIEILRVQGRVRLADLARLQVEVAGAA